MNSTKNLCVIHVFSKPWASAPLSPMYAATLIISDIYSVFSDNSETLGFIGIYFLEIKIFSSGGQNGRYQKCEIAILLNVKFHVFWRYRFALYFKHVGMSVCSTF